jgi:hypothetical protein
MPQLGGETAAPTRREVTAYATAPRASVRTVLLFLFVTLVLHNIFFNVGNLF